MKPNTAGCFVLCGVSLWLRLRPTSTRVGQAVSTGFAALAVVVGALTLLEYLSGHDIGIDQLLVRDDTSTTGAPGRMGPNTALSFVLEGAALILLHSRRGLAQILALGGAGIAAIALAGYAYSVPTSLGIASYTQMALHTAAALFVLGSGIASAHPRQALMGVITSSGPGGMLTRTMLPAVVIGPFVLGWFRLFGQRTGWYGTEFGVALLAASSALTFGVIVLLFARRLDRSEDRTRFALEARIESERRLQFALEVGQIGHWELDLTNHTAHRSLQHDQIFGYETLLPEWTYEKFLEHVVPEDRGLVDEKFRQAVAAQHNWDFECRIVRCDHEVRWISAAGRPQMDERGQPWRLAGIVQDITERKRAADALQKTEERMRFALDAGGIGIWDAEMGTGHITWSETLEVMHGLAPGTFGGTFEAFIERIHPDDRASVQAATQQSQALRTDSDVEYRTIWPDGSVHWLIEKGRGIYNDSGKAIRLTGIGIEVTDHRKLEAQLLQSQKMDAIGQLAGGVAHDFNNLLTAILGYAEMLAPTFSEKDSRSADLEQIQKAATRASHLTRQLLAFSRRQILQPAILDLNALVTDLTTLLRRLIGEDVELKLSLDNGVGRIKADPGQIEQVVMNLALNARDAMPRGGRLTIETGNVDVDEKYFRRHFVSNETKERRFIVLVISDTGTGMDAATKARIFEPFFTTKPKGKGTGLGLATVYGIVKQSGGWIWVYSEPGEGATFKVYLPRTDQEAGPEPAVAPTETSLSGSETILLVEDEEAVRLLSRQLLERKGYRVIAAADAEEALLIAAKETAPIHLLLTDVVMPGRSGPELFKELEPVRPDMKVLYFSGYTDEAIIRRGLLAADTPFVQKPFAANALLRKVRNVLDAGERSQ